MPSTSTTISTSETFDYSDADVIIRSNAPNQVDFKVHKLILRLSSPFFESMFTLPKSPLQKTSVDDSLPIVDMSESSTILDKLFRMVYPIPDPVFNNLDALTPIVQAAHKFDMQAVLGSLRRVIVTPAFLDKEPMRVYAIAATYDFGEEAKIASRYTLRLNLLDYPLSIEMKSMSGYYYHQLLQMHRTRGKAAKQIIDSAKLSCRYSCHSSFWTGWKSDAAVELSERPVGDVVFSQEFMYRNERSTCERASAGSQYCNRVNVLIDLKKAIDSLPDTI
ncbi:hypothetical protein C8Q75DRAFT_758277 [Abortiporus biennis]|nr:hypothetical protein C8Q75DRAFT_758277 [Abortiporus biennis]